MRALLDIVRPAFVMLPGWSYNDRVKETYASKAAEDILFARMILAADQVRSVGAVPIFMTRASLVARMQGQRTSERAGTLFGFRVSRRQMPRRAVGRIQSQAFGLFRFSRSHS
jgi:hypothetical protein